MSAYHFVDSEYCRPQGSMPRIEYTLNMRQEPDRAKVCTSKEKERRPIDPPPIIQLKLKDERQDPCHNYLQSPHLFLCVDLCPANDSSSQGTISNALAGTSVSSLYRLKDQDNTDGGFFVFGDLSVKVEGQFRLRFYLFEVRKGDVCFLQSIISGVFQVYNAKQFPGMLDSTFISRSFSDQGVRIRIRKEHRIKMKRPPQRPLLSPERTPQYMTADQRSAVPHLPVQYPASTGQGQGFDDRANAEYHYAGAPIRHVPRPVDFHPYPRSQYSSAPYFDRPPPSEMLPPSYAGPPYGTFVPGTHPPPEYAVPPGYGKVPTHTQQIDYYYPSDSRGGQPPPPSAPHYPSYHERQPKPYPESQTRHNVEETRPYPAGYSRDTTRNINYVPESRPASSYSVGPPQQQYYTPQPHPMRQSPQVQPQRGPPYYPEPASVSYPPSRGDPGQHAPSPHQHAAHGRRESRHSINAILEEGRRPSPMPISRPASENSSMERNSPTVRANPSSRDSEESSANVRLPPLRNGSNVERESEAEQPQTKSNSNLWKLVSAATDE